MRDCRGNEENWAGAVRTGDFLNWNFDAGADLTIFVISYKVLVAITRVRSKPNY